MASFIWTRVEKHKKKTDDVLAQTFILKNLTKSERKKLLRIGHVRRFSKDEVIFKRGQPSFGLYVVLEGTVDIYVRNRSKETKITSFKKGDVMGELSLVENNIRTASARAADDCVLFFLFNKDLKQLFNEDPRLGISVYDGILAAMSIRIEEVDKKL